MNFWVKSVEQITYKAVLLSAQVSIKSKVWSHIHEKLDSWRISTSDSHYQRYTSSSNILNFAMLTLLCMT